MTDWADTLYDSIQSGYDDAATLAAAVTDGHQLARRLGVRH